MKNKVAWLLSLLIPIAVIISLWVPPVVHYWVHTPTADKSAVERLRQVPVDGRLREIEAMSLSLPLKMGDQEILHAAERLITGELLLKGYSPVRVSPRFNDSDLSKGLPTWSLQYGALVVPEIFLEAYEISGNQKWLTAALDFIRPFLRYEKSAWLPDGFLWNDHAIAGRVSVLTKLWRLYRHSKGYSEEVGRELIGHILRCRAQLGKKSQFTFSTNHGVMQNIGLLQIGVAFPGLSEEEKYLAIAVGRLEKQFRYYISDEGVVLEHSAGYHQLGFQLVGMAARLLEMLGRQIPQRWKELHKKSREFLEVITFPDGGLPMFGNTNSDSEPVRDFLTRSLLAAEQDRCAQDGGMYLYPVSGYAVHWSCNPDPSQTVMALSFFQGHGHKHADELSILTWAHGKRWLTSTGYWPYGIPGDESAYGWRGSNAPHWVGESANEARASTILSFAASNQLSFLDARRNNVDGTGFRRQVIQLGSDLWIVLDMPYGKQDRDVEILWTFFPGIRTTPKGGQDYLAVSGESAMWVSFSGDSNIRGRLLSGEQSPWQGWVVKNGVPTLADTLSLQFSGSQKAPIVSTFRLGRIYEDLSVQTHLSRYQSLDDWELKLKIGGMGTTTLVRFIDGKIYASGLEGGKQVSLSVEKVADVGTARVAIRNAYKETAAEYPRYREVFHYRLKLSKIFLVLLALNELVLLFVWAYGRKMYRVLRLASVGSWLGLGLLSHLWYFS